MRPMHLSVTTLIMITTSNSSSSPDVIEAALDSGGLGYVVKAHAGRELLAAVETVCAGGKYVSNGEYRATQP